MKAISLWNPWAALVGNEAKRWETRSWRTAHRGTIAIHAARRSNRELRALSDSEPFAKALGCKFDDLAFGAIIAITTLEEVLRTGEWVRRYCSRLRSNPPSPEDLEHTFGNYGCGRFAWRFGLVIKLNKPIPYRGRQQLFTLDAATVLEIQNQMPF